jgi:hypothetical protein
MPHLPKKLNVNTFRKTCLLVYFYILCVNVSRTMQFTSCIFHHVSRVLNLAAHQLARGCSSVANSLWRGVPPNCIRVAFCNNFMFMIFFKKKPHHAGVVLSLRIKH